MIKSFADRRTVAIFEGRTLKGIPSDLRFRAKEKLRQLNSASALDFLRTPRGNRLEALHGDRAGQYSIRVNDQWRICFIWRDRHAWSVELVDYH